MDYVIIGAGPSGLVCTYLLEKMGRKVTIIDRYGLGGCHRVLRQGGLFGEHGPRVYSDSFANMRAILTDMNGPTAWADLFTSFESDPLPFSILTISEMAHIGAEYMQSWFFAPNGESVAEWMSARNFSDAARAAIDALCRKTDGADSTRYSVSKFMQLINQQSTAQLYQPKKPNDVGLFTTWKQPANLVIGNVASVDTGGVTLDDGHTFSGSRVLLCLPPQHLANLIDLPADWVAETAYNPSQSVAFHWAERLPPFEPQGQKSKIEPQGQKSKIEPPGLVYVVLTDYMTFAESKTVISCYTNDMNATPAEILAQLAQSIGSPLPPPTATVLNASNDKAYIRPANYTKPGDFFHVGENIWTIGTHNDNSAYAFTSFESATTNAIVAINKLEGQNFPLIQATSLNWMIVYFLIFIISALVLSLRFSPLGSIFDFLP
jgi:hypothetical protein